jgi:predicted ATPase
MITRIQLTNFKSFQHAELLIGPLTLLVGTNAAGKSNIRDALRFLHGIGRGYALADIIGGRFGEGGKRLWGGIRGGTREIAFAGESSFAIDVQASVPVNGARRGVTYHIRVDPGQASRPATIISEHLRLNGDESGCYIFRADAYRDDVKALRVWFRKTAPGKPDGLDVRWPIPDFDQIVQQAPVHGPPADDPRRSMYLYETILGQRPALVQLAESTNDRMRPLVRNMLQALNSVLASMRFLDLSPDAMRQPSFPGQNTLGDRGENLSSVLQSICTEDQRKQTLVSWLQALTPLDAVDFDFPADQIGRILATLIEANGQRTTAYSASDGTLRFLAMLAALLGPETAGFYLFEELENGIHPTRLHLLLQLIEQQVASGATQVLATTHSPQLLRLVSPETREYTSVAYRLPEHDFSQIKRLVDVPNADQTLEDEDLARLHESGWLEDAVAFTTGEE